MRPEAFVGKFRFIFCRDFCSGRNLKSDVQKNCLKICSIAIVLGKVNASILLLVCMNDRV